MFLKNLSSFFTNTIKPRDVTYRGKMPNVILPFMFRGNKETSKEEKEETKTLKKENQTDEKTKENPPKY